MDDEFRCGINLEVNRNDCMDEASSDDSEYDTDNDVEDVSWMMSLGVASTWKLTDEGVRSSTRLRYQQHPIQNPT
jgi:hypothetical protein